jgi:hypothetical protein
MMFRDLKNKKKYRNVYTKLNSKAALKYVHNTRVVNTGTELGTRRGAIIRRKEIKYG